jgi:multidrug transporter EmrE-like cation transporter
MPIASGYKLLILLAIYTAMSTFGLFKIKESGFAMNVGLSIGVVFYLAGFVLWMYILKLFDLSVAFPMAAGALIVATQAVGYTMLHEPYTLSKISGSLLIIVGIALIHLET